MRREEFFSRGVLGENESNVVGGCFDDAEKQLNDIENQLNDIMTNIREAITGVMTKMYEKCSSTEFVSDRFTIINRLGDITIIDREIDNEDELSLDNIESVDLLMDILSQFV